MATISLYADKMKKMPGLFQEVKKSVADYKSEIAALKKKSLQINQNVCNLADVIQQVQTSTQTQEEKMDSLDTFQKNSEEFLEETARIDREVAEVVRKRKEDFFDRYRYLKPDCEKNGWEKFCDGCKKAGEWCKEHWKIIVTVVLVVVAVVVIVCTAGAALGPIATILAGAAKGLLVGVITGGLMGGLTSVASGGSFFEGFENGAFAGALTGALFGGIGGAGAVFGNVFGTSCKAFSIIKLTFSISGGLSLGMGAFDLLSFGAGLLLGQDNPFTALNLRLHSSSVYNAFQFVVSALAVFSASAYHRMKPMQKTCFAAGTMILTAAGFVAIEKIKAGDRVISTNPETFETTEKTVLETYIRDASRLVHLTMKGEKITTTADHPFYVKGTGFVNAEKLCIGDKLIDPNGTAIAIENIKFEATQMPVTVYNFQVADFHTYYVGNCGALVHNSNCKPMGRRNGNTLRNNQAQNKQFKDVAKKLGLDKSQQRYLHECITHKGLGYQELLEFAKELFNK